MTRLREIAQEISRPLFARNYSPIIVRLKLETALVIGMRDGQIMRYENFMQAFLTADGVTGLTSRSELLIRWVNALFVDFPTRNRLQITTV